MDDQETTTDAVVETGAEAQPVETTEAPAVQEDVTSEAETTEPSDNPQGFDEDTLKWMTAKGIDPSSSDALTKLAKSAREAEKAMHSKAQRASELEKSMATVSDEYAENVAEQTGQDPELLKRLQRMEVKDTVREFWDNNPEARQYEKEMIDVVAQKPYLAGDLDAIYAVVLKNNTQSLQSEGGRKALESLAGKQRASAPTGSAVSSAPTRPSITRAMIAEKTQAGDVEWLNQNSSTINQLVAEGKLL